MSSLRRQFKSLLYQAYYIGLIPKLNSKANRFDKDTKPAIVFGTLAFITFLYTLWYFIVTLPDVVTFNIASRIFQHVLVNAIFFEFILVHHWIKFEKVQRLWDTLFSIDGDFRKYFKIIPGEVRYISAKLAITNCTYVALHAFYLWSQGSLYVGFYFVNEVFVKFALHTTKFVMGHTFTVIRERLHTIGVVLEQNDPVKMYSSEILIRIHSKCADAVDMCNDLYGLNIAMSVLHLVLYVLRFVSLLLEKPASSQERTMLLMLVMWALYGFAQAIIVVVMSHKLTDESKVCLAKTYKALNFYNDIPAVRKCLSRLTKQMSARTPIITAAGWFNVDLNMLFTLANLVTTYTIVIVQFSTPNGCRNE